MSKTPITGNVCLSCGVAANVLKCLKKYGRPPKMLQFQASTFHVGVCAICKEKTEVTEQRDFYYPRFDLLLEEMRKFKKVKKVK